MPQLRILQGVYVKVRPGTVCSLFGRNGSGKSTLLKIAAGQISPQSGRLILDGERYHKKARRRRFRHLAYLPQESMMPADVTVRRMIRSFPSASDLYDDSIIAPLITARISDLSGGVRRYLETSLLLSLGRKYVLLDEPFTGVEPGLIERISALITDAASNGSGVLLTDHYHQYALEIADEAYLMASKQCRHLNGSTSLRVQLQQHGYLPDS